MATTYTGDILIEVDEIAVLNKVYPIKSNAITIPSNSADTATITITCSNSGWLYNTSPTYAAESKIVICDSAGNNAVTILQKQLQAAGADRSGGYTKSINISALKGKRIYGKVVPVTEYGGAGVTINKKLAISLEISSGGAKVTAGNQIKATDRSQTGTSTTQGAVMTDSHFSAGTKITAADFNSAYNLS